MANDVVRIYRFDRFELRSDSRTLFAGGVEVAIGGRAFDVLLTLVEARGRLVTKDELMSRAWSNIIVDDNTLQFQISTLRRILGDRRDIIKTVSGRGYQLVPNVSSEGTGTAPPTVAAQAPSRPLEIAPVTAAPNNVPAVRSKLIGRDGLVLAVVSLMAEHRLVTLVGPGGIGKTRIAIELAHEMIANFKDGVWFVELGSLSRAELVPSAIATAPQLDFKGDISSAKAVASMLAAKQVLLVIDNCEHLIGATAALIEALLDAGGGVRVLATSREPLHVEAEHLYRVPALDVPAVDDCAIEEALTFGAVELLVTRIRAMDPEFSLTPQIIASISRICRRLDGTPLAIELAAARAASLGLDMVATLLDHRFGLLTGGRRTADLRQQTLQATLDWSYDLLTDSERVVLNRVAVFAGDFTLEGARAVARGSRVTDSDAIISLANLVAKSLVANNMKADRTTYKLLETTRLYARTKLAESGELDQTAQKHAEHFIALLEAAESDLKRGSPDRLSAYRPDLDNIRAALEWAFSPCGNTTVGVALAAAAAPLWMVLSLLPECHSWMAKAVAQLGAADRGTRRELVLQCTLASSVVLTHGITDDIYRNWTKAADLAESLGDFEQQVDAMLILWLREIRLANFEEALVLARRSEAVASRSACLSSVVTSDTLLGMTMHVRGEFADARQHMQRALDRDTTAATIALSARFGMDRHTDLLTVFANVLWLQGFADQALQTSAAALSEARASGRAITICVSLVWSVFNRLLTGTDPVMTEEQASEIIVLAEKHSLVAHHGMALCLIGMCRAQRSDFAAGERLLSEGLNVLNKVQFRIFRPIYLAELARSKAHAGKIEEGLTALAELNHQEGGPVHWLTSEIFRIKGEILLLQSKQNAQAAELLFDRSLELARRQGGLSWELRAATSLGRLLHDQGRSDIAREKLLPVYGRFSEGHETADLRSAQQLLDELN